jgi:glycosyltransferase involved in cell wall biosynthesis
MLPRVIAVSSDVRETLIRSGADPAKVIVLLNGIDPDAFRRDAERRERLRHELRLAPGDIAFGGVGRVERQKRFDLLIDAFAAIHKDHPETRLVIVGDGSLKGSLEAQAERLGVAAACRFTGHRLDIAALHDAFDAFVQSSEYEGTPNAVLEAMAMETPCLATDVGGTRELTVDGVHGLVVPPHDVPALVTGMRTLVADPAAARTRARAARARIEGELSFAERTRRLEAIYDDLMASRGTRQPAAAARSIGVSGA